MTINESMQVKFNFMTTADVEVDEIVGIPSKRSMPRKLISLEGKADSKKEWDVYVNILVDLRSHKKELQSILAEVSEESYDGSLPSDYLAKEATGVITEVDLSVERARSRSR
jgi:hypothetical protein